MSRAQAILFALLVGALSLAALRTDLIRMRYGLASALREHQELLEERRELTAALRRLRDPARLTRLAAELELARPQRVIDLSPPVAAGPR